MAAVDGLSAIGAIRVGAGGTQTCLDRLDLLPGMADWQAAAQ